MPHELLANTDKQVCSETGFKGDECYRCYLRKGWKSVGWIWHGDEDEGPLCPLPIIQWQEGSKTHISASDQGASFAVAAGPLASLAIVITW